MTFIYEGEAVAPRGISEISGCSIVEVLLTGKDSKDGDSVTFGEYAFKVIKNYIAENSKGRKRRFKIAGEEVFISRLIEFEVVKLLDKKPKKRGKTLTVEGERYNITQAAEFFGYSESVLNEKLKGVSECILNGFHTKVNWGDQKYKKYFLYKHGEFIGNHTLEEIVKIADVTKYQIHRVISEGTTTRKGYSITK